MNDETGIETAPRVAFLGFYDRAETITKGHHVFWHDNLIGLSRFRIFHFLPVNLRGQKVLLAMFNPRAGDKFLFVFRCESAHKEFTFTFEISTVMTLERKQDFASPEKTAVSETIQGWMYAFQTLNTDIFVYEPGIYNIYLRSHAQEICLGEVTFSFVPAEPLTPEEVAAIRSNPLAVKVVRAEFRCKLCERSFRAYAGLERNQKLESEGWTWSWDITSDRYTCQCGAQDFGLQPIKMGLQGYLKDTFRAERYGSVDAAFSSVRLYENAALEEYCRQFMEMINSSPREEQVQSFLEGHEIFFSMFVSMKLMVKPRVLTKHVADFAILNSRKELLLIELERPNLRLLRKDGIITAALQHAIGQAQDWLRVFDDHRTAALDAWDLKPDDVAHVRGVIIAGRTPTNESDERRLRSYKLTDIELYTYDDLLKAVKNLTRGVAAI